ncbi:MAG: 2-succinyl-6-hydroxy-2,4-cyclohexadiene-1-carboxylate synthase [Ignavibacteria bacterium]|nr:2-succinyl-6-hydroxy-2,4-cyclohexadiene-1-carboxylate synthase [Ignavibacteria bacterium]MBT8382932.1 2-succinyl-6-hydroxy-2,4-cyclohexadiene-1-carboxylate synthase [Ignavibacteria bacterium]MBT8391901.1 2-succinyl-6-hydroxy-2,4-cyclohexadiene-1-carboxylate synthase [Ignavibacteria bacterium]NNJ53309.1 2-succinyl-6-hydroxy-2,4-cyclohexadiene-1-carboxylate synthase [Ignavibacteriaceae bacterium]NNL22247.1 2-succinyl-6-hydroxy-2,4-cyclohexadiene-1-carboxylate synthase [Ignavibacteriaceae bacte
MLLSYYDIKLNVEFFSEFNPKNKSILFLHGFTGCANDWKEVAEKIGPEFNKIALDLIGHGKSDSPGVVKFYKSDESNEQILFILNHFEIDKLILCGYSMGGRTALRFASTHPEKISTLILESTSAGIENEAERKSRIKSDETLANFIESHSIEEFVEKWMGLEIFKSQKALPKEKIQKLKNAKSKNLKIGLANSLRGFGTGVMPYLGNELKKMNFPILLITGELDEKFTIINGDLVKYFKNAEHKIIPDAGHNVHLEKTIELVSVIKEFLIQF